MAYAAFLLSLSIHSSAALRASRAFLPSSSSRTSRSNSSFSASFSYLDSLDKASTANPATYAMGASFEAIPIGVVS